MIDRCDSEIATWSEAGDNFVVKNTEKFASVSSNETYSLSSATVRIGKRNFLLISTTTFRRTTERPSSLFQAFQLFELCSSTEFLRLSKAKDRPNLDFGCGSTHRMFRTILSRKISKGQATAIASN
jgi:hypothetical protein